MFECLSKFIDQFSDCFFSDLDPLYLDSINESEYGIGKSVQINQDFCLCQNRFNKVGRIFAPPQYIYRLFGRLESISIFLFRYENICLCIERKSLACLIPDSAKDLRCITNGAMGLFKIANKPIELCEIVLGDPLTNSVPGLAV